MCYMHSFLVDCDKYPTYSTGYNLHLHGYYFAYLYEMYQSNYILYIFVRVSLNYRVGWRLYSSVN